MSKKFSFKFPSMIALTLFGAAFTTHHAEASENKQNAANNVIDDQQNIENANVAKHQVSNAAQNISGVQTYQDPTLVKSNTTNNTYTYDAKLDNLNQSASSQNNSTRSNTNDTVKNSDTISNDQSDNTKHNNNEVATTSTTSTDSTKLVTSEDSNHKLNSNRITTETPSTHNESAQVSNTHKLNTDEPKTTLNNVESQNNSISKAQSSTTVVNNKQQKVEDNATTTNNDNNKVSLSSTTESDSTSKNLSNTSDNTTVNNEDTTLKKNNTQTSPMHNTLKVRAYSTALNNTHVNNKATTSTQSNDASVSDSTSSVHKDIGGKGGPATVSTYSTTSTTSSLPKYVPQVKSSINNYIRTNNLKAPSIEEHYTSYFPKYGYRNGVGKPEGIVVHDTANDNSTIEGEINYMRNNYTNAFVHAFVDGNRIIETAPTDYLSWGAGPYGNNRFINVEIVHTHDYASFARSMNNYADYAATQLQYYGLKPDSAEYDAKGTVWTHYAISRYLGGTDHADPHAYLSNHNYSYDELYDLINEKYLIKMGKVAPWGTTSTNNSTPTTKPSINNKKLTVTSNNGLAQIKSENSGLYTTVYDSKGKTTNQVHNTLAVTKSAQLGKDKYYLVSDYNSGKLYGWVKQNETIYNTITPKAKVNKSYTIKPGTTLYTVPWGNYNQIAGTVSKSNQSPFKASASQQVGKSTYVYGSVNGLTGWVSKYYLNDIQNKADTTNILNVSQLNNTLGQVAKKNNGAYTTVYDSSGKINPSINGNTYRVTKKATLNNKNFYLISDFNGNQSHGWIPSSEINIQTTTPINDGIKKYNIKENSNIYETPWGSSSQIKATVPSKGDVLKSIDALKVGSNTYLHGVINNVWGWILSDDVQTVKASQKTSSVQTVSKIAQVNSTNDGIRSSIYDASGKHAKQYANKTYVVTKEKKLDDNTYVLLSSTSGNTPLGWYNIKDLNIKNLDEEQKVKGTYTVNQNNNGLYTIAWGTNQQRLDKNNIANQTFKASKSTIVDGKTYLYGTVNNQTGWIALKDLTDASSVDTAEDYNDDLVITNSNSFYYDDPTSAKAYSLKPFNEQIFQVTKRKVVNGITWYYGKLSNGKSVWIKKSDLQQQLVKLSKNYRTLDEVTKIQQNVYGAPPQVQRNNSGWSNATYSEIKNAMNAKTLAKNPALKYQFLRLDRPQLLSVDRLNRLLKGKGMLENQGQAFANAAKLTGVNEIYLIAHALLETGNGQSKLAKGANLVNNQVVSNSPIKYYNVYGIGAYDYAPLVNGINYAKQSGWNSISKAIIDGAKFIAQDYIKSGQNTLYKMRWNPDQPGTHQYATDINWSNLNAKSLKYLYDQINSVGKYFEIPVFNQ
ncbi:glucosaminidase domain-containing protein [Staphylococcus hominis]